MIVMMIGTLALYMGANAYIFWRLLQALGALPIALRVVFGVLFWVAACGMFISFGMRNVAMPEFLHRTLHIVGTSWLLFTLYMAVALLHRYCAMDNPHLPPWRVVRSRCYALGACGRIYQLSPSPRGASDHRD